LYFRGLRPRSAEDGDNFRLRVGAGEGEVGSSVKAGLRARGLVAGAGIDESSVVALALACSDMATASSRVKAFVAVLIS